MSEPVHTKTEEGRPDPPVYRLRWRDSLLGAQILFVAFGALVLVPILTGLNPNVALFTAGAGTLLFQLITVGQVPVFLASSFAFVAPIIYGVETGTRRPLQGVPYKVLILWRLIGFVWFLGSRWGFNPRTARVPVASPGGGPVAFAPGSESAHEY